MNWLRLMLWRKERNINTERDKWEWKPSQRFIIVDTLMTPQAELSVLVTLALEPPLLAETGESDLFPLLVVIVVA